MPDEMMPETPDVATDRRRPPFCFQTLDALDAIRANFTGTKRATALAVYLALTEVANRHGGALARGGFDAAREELAEAAGVSRDTFDRYAREFVDIGLLEVERRKVGAVNLPNRWVLIDAPTGPGAPPGRTDAATPGRTGAALRARDPSPRKEVTAEEETSGAAFPAPPKLVKIDGRNRGFDALAECCGIDPTDPNRAGEIVVALNGGRAVPVGIRALAWREITQSVEGAAEVAAEHPERFEHAVVAMIGRRCRQYRDMMGDAILTPTALAKWWMSLERMTAERGERPLTPEEMEARGG